MKLLPFLVIFLSGIAPIIAQQTGFEQAMKLETWPTGEKAIAWHGHVGRTYFIQTSDSTNHLNKWKWAPLIESGNNEEISHQVDATTAKGFFRLKYTDQVPGPDETLDTADFDSDGISNLGEITSIPQTDPLNPDTDGDGMPDGWEVANGLDPNDSGLVNPANGAAGDPDGDGLINLLEWQHGGSARLKDTDGDGMDDGPEFAAAYNIMDADENNNGEIDGYEDDDDDGYVTFTEALAATNSRDSSKKRTVSRRRPCWSRHSPPNS